MQIILNGQPHNLDNSPTIEELLIALDLKGKVAVEINQAIVPRSLFASHHINPGDAVEIVKAIGGG